MTVPSGDPNILGLFHAEAAEHLELLNAELLVIEDTPERAAESLPKILRAAHSLKGTAAAAGLTRVEQLMHNWESCAQALARGHVTLASDVLDLFYRGLDAVEAEVHWCCTGQRPVTATSAPTLDELRRVFGADTTLIDVPLEHQPTVNEASPLRSDEAATLRVATAKVDRLMANVEELVQVKASTVSRLRDLNRLTGLLAQIARRAPRRAIAEQDHRSRRTLGVSDQDVSELCENALELCAELQTGERRHAHRLEDLSTRLQDDIRSVRMVPARVVFAPFTRMVRDLCRKLGKRATLALVGADTEVDRDLLEIVKDAVMHLLRNAIAHGIESPEARQRIGKPPEGTITLTVASRAGGLDLTVADDGGGIDSAKIRATLVQRGLLSTQEAATIAESDLESYVFQPGFSTADGVDSVSGRGVGLDVVREAVEGCGGSVSLASERGLGTRFLLRLPLNLTTMRILLVRSGGEMLAIPVNAVSRVLRVDRDSVHRVNSGPAIELDGRPVPIAPLSEVLGLGNSTPRQDRALAVVATSGRDFVALVVDAVDGEQELVVKGFDEHLGQVPNIGGATVLASGRIAPLVNVADVVRGFSSVRTLGRVFEESTATAREKKRVLIVDDSITTRTLEKSILEAVGYAVSVATDGHDAMARLRERPFDLVLSDVQMPRVDGIELVLRIRKDERLRNIPVVLVSSLASDDDKKRGLDAGANAYIGKSEFRQEVLLATLERLV